jgi:hypothetical protein
MKLTTHLRIVKGKVVLVHTMKALRGSKGIDPLILSLGARWGECSTSRHGRFNSTKRHPYSFNTVFSGAQRRSGLPGEDTNIFIVLELESRTIQLVA